MFGSICGLLALLLLLGFCRSDVHFNQLSNLNIEISCSCGSGGTFCRPQPSDAFAIDEQQNIGYITVHDNPMIVTYNLTTGGLLQYVQFHNKTRNFEKCVSYPPLLVCLQSTDNGAIVSYNMTVFPQARSSLADITDVNSVSFTNVTASNISMITAASAMTILVDDNYIYLVLDHLYRFTKDLTDIKIAHVGLTVDKVAFLQLADNKVVIFAADGRMISVNKQSLTVNQIYANINLKGQTTKAAGYFSGVHMYTTYFQEALGNYLCEYHVANNITACKYILKTILTWNKVTVLLIS
jgi:hypothetical protein